MSNKFRQEIDDLEERITETISSIVGDGLKKICFEDDYETYTKISYCEVNRAYILYTSDERERSLTSLNVVELMEVLESL